MLYVILEKIIRSIRHHIPCPHCKKKFRLRDFFISDLLDGELYIELDCANCKRSSTIAASITSSYQGISFVSNNEVDNSDKKQSKMNKVMPISKDELKKFNDKFKSFSGGFTELFKENKNK